MSAHKHRLSAFGIECLTASHPEVKAIRRTLGDGTLHGNKVWDASFVLMDFLSIDGLPKNARVLDVGCGWGPLTCYLKKTAGARVLSVDADARVEPYLNLHAELNGIRAHFWQAKLHQLSVDDLSMVDYVMGGDICFWDSLRDDWQKLLKRAKRAGVKQVYLADPGRSPFFELVDWADERFDTDFWDHDITHPIKSQHYILQVNLNT